jgi:hypothetical protein
MIYLIQLKRPTKRAPDAGDSAAFLTIIYTSAKSCSQTESTPTPAQVTQTVSACHNLNHYFGGEK